jgi:membrane protein EpsK
MPAAAGDTTFSARYLKNIAWTWTGVALNLFIGVFLSPYVIRKLGPEGYGIWALFFSIISYYSLIDFGVRSALIHYTARFAAQKDYGRINELVSTVIAYYTLGSAILVLIAIPLARGAGRLLHISEHFRADFGILLVATCFTVLLTNIFPGCLEGLQRFDLTGRIYTTILFQRSVGTLLLLYTGHGILALGFNVIAAQVLGSGLAYGALRGSVPCLRLSPKLVRPSLFRMIFGYAVHNFVGSLASQVSSQSATILVGIFRPAAFIGYFSFPLRMIQYSVDFTSRVGNVAASRAAELTGANDQQRILPLAKFTNRYCMVIFMPLAIFLLVWGRNLIRVWVGPEFAIYSAPLLPWFVIGSVLASTAQQNTGAVLVGMARHRTYSRGLVVEAAFSVGGTFALTPKYGILGAAIANTVPMMLMRGLVSPWLLCRYLQTSFVKYMRGILAGPLTIAAPVFAACWISQSSWLPGTGWRELIPAGLATAALYWTIAYWTIIEKSHREAVWGLAKRVQGRIRPVRARADAAQNAG